MSPPFFQAALSNVLNPAKSPFFENLIGGSTPAKQKGGCALLLVNFPKKFPL